MITFITAQLIWTLLGSPCPLNSWGCYDLPQNIIYIDNTLSAVEKEYALYHEIGHSFYYNKSDTDLFPTDQYYNSDEMVANYFAFYVYSINHPDRKPFYLKYTNKEQRNFFRKTCPSKCVKEILVINNN